jgi:hypothetical protein
VNVSAAAATGRVYGRRPDGAASGAGAIVTCISAETFDFQAYRGQEPPRFANDAELECAKILDYHGVPWEYEPRTFVLERD